MGFCLLTIVFNKFSNWVQRLILSQSNRRKLEKLQVKTGSQTVQMKLPKIVEKIVNLFLFVISAS